MPQLVKVEDPFYYKVYLKDQLSNIIKDKRKRDLVLDDMYQVFLDGIKFGQGKLQVEI